MAQVDQVDTGQLAALAAVVEFGSFDAAAAHLHVTPSAISQRIKALEQRTGQVLVVREKPCVATPAGTPLLRLAAQTALLQAEALAEMRGGPAETMRISLAVNADSMATWFTGVFAHLTDALLDIRIEDQDLSARLLREGVVMGAVTTENAAVPGCRVEPLGIMRYRPVATRAFVERHLPQGLTAEAVSTAPSLAWNRDDSLQDQLVRQAFGADVRRPVHYVATAAGFGAAVHAGLGWGMYPEQLIDASFVQISEQHLDVPLYWQCWKLDSTTVALVTDAVKSAATGLLPPR
ncbi:LysR family transcriptional regulator ArgP [Mycolicibacterium sp. 3033]|nr:LysR family transcriptional regulator ArgP [Mycolicibacterium aurantiacum]